MSTLILFNSIRQCKGVNDLLLGRFQILRCDDSSGVDSISRHVAVTKRRGGSVLKLDLECCGYPQRTTPRLAGMTFQAVFVLLQLEYGTNRESAWPFPESSSGVMHKPYTYVA
jgi:hypothetical protein